MVLFLAVMSSSRSDIVCVNVFVCPCFSSFLFFHLVSLKFLLVLKRFNGVLRLVKGYLKCGCFKEVLRAFTESFKGVSRKFKGCFKEVSRVFQESFN